MVKIRLSKQGAKGNIFYRIVATEEKRKRSGKALEILGYWQPSTKKLTVDKEKVKKWLVKGAIMTSGASKLIK